MPSEIQRYELEDVSNSGDYWVTLAIRRNCNGDYVLYAEHLEDKAAAVAAKDAEIAALRTQWNQLDRRNEQRHREWHERMLSLQSKLTAAEAEIERLKGLITTGVGT